jgi:hypothetical protein
MRNVNVVKADYLVATVPLTSIDQEASNRLHGLVVEGDYRRIYGFAGFVKEKLFVGDNGQRLMIQATGAKADEAAYLINSSWLSLSVARIDLQVTVYVADADSVIRSTIPPKAYKSVRMINLNERGSTLYVGSPKSRCRLRIYNKSAEQGEEPTEKGERLRIEVQLRNDYADRALVNLHAGAGDMFFRFYVRRMTDAYIDSIIEMALKNSDKRAMIDVEKEMSIDTRKAWIENSVIPALARMSVLDSDYYKKLLERLRLLIE